MCMSTVKFATKEVNGEYVGEGYKVFDEKIKSPWFPTPNYKLDKWYKADVGGGLLYHKHSDRYGDINYPRGYHIFLNLEDAINYRSTCFGPVYKVQYKEILAFGQNEVEYNPYYKDAYCGWKQGDCIISLYMKLVEEIKIGKE
jgi:hypothetical protein